MTAPAHSPVLLIGPRNCEQATGLPWRRCRDAAVRLGVRRLRVGRARLLPAAELMAALEREQAAGAESSAPTGAEDAAAALRRQLGLRLVTGVAR